MGPMPTKQDNADKNIYFSAFMLIISMAFYLFFAFFDGAVICVDSPDYIEMNLAREPLYPLFLAFLRFLFGGVSADFYLFMAALFQSILAAVATWSLTAYLHKEFHLNKAFSLLLLTISPAVSLLCRFAAKRGSMYSNSILTEGITISCYLLFFRFLFEYITKQTKKALFACSLFSFVMICARKQMIFSLFMLVLAILIVSCLQKRIGNGLIVAVLCSLAILMCSTGLDLGYNYLLRGEAVRHSSDTRFITTMAFYTAGRNDFQYIEEKEIQDLFLKIYDICDEKEYLKPYADKGWFNRSSHFGDHYDHIQIDTMWPLITAYAREHYGDNVVAVNSCTDRIMNIINVSVIPHNMTKIAATFFDNILSGLVTTVAQKKSLLIGYSILIYLLYVLLLFYHLSHRRNDRLFLFSLLTLISVFLNVGLVSLVIFCQTRYTIYNMPLFYISFLLMLYEPVRSLLKK